MLLCLFSLDSSSYNQQSWRPGLPASTVQEIWSWSSSQTSWLSGMGSKVVGVTFRNKRSPQKSLVPDCVWLVSDMAPAWWWASQAWNLAGNGPRPLAVWAPLCGHLFWALWLLPGVRSNAHHSKTSKPQHQACFPPGQRANAITSVTNLHSWGLGLLTETFTWDSSL